MYNGSSPLFKLEFELGQLERDRERIESECAACDSALAAARKLLVKQRADIAPAEARVRAAQDARREVVAHRTELQRLGNEIAEAIEDARIRRRQVEQRAAGFRAAAAFAGAARREAQRLENPERIARERLAEERASREATDAEALAVEERQNETTLLDRYSGLDASIVSERQREIEFTAERAASARAATDLHETIARLEREIEYGGGTLAHVDEERLRAADRYRELEMSIEDLRNPSDAQIVARIEALREVAASATEQRRILEALAGSRKRPVRDARPAPARRAAPTTRAPLQWMRVLQAIFAR